MEFYSIKDSLCSFLLSHDPFGIQSSSKLPLAIKIQKLTIMNVKDYAYHGRFQPFGFEHI